MTEGLVYSDAPPHAPVVVNETSTPAGALMRCEDLRKNDKVAESRKKLYGGIGWGAFILGFISVFVGAVGEVFVVFYGTAVFAVVAIGAAIAYGISGRAGTTRVGGDNCVSPDRLANARSRPVNSAITSGASNSR